MKARVIWRNVWSKTAKTLYILPAIVVNWSIAGLFIHLRFMTIWICIGLFAKRKTLQDRWTTDDHLVKQPKKPSSSITNQIWPDEDE